MSVEVLVPALGESIVEATVGRWLKSEGDVVVSGDALVELETDKVNVEITAEQNGVLQQITHKEGDTVTVGDILATLEDGAGTTTSASQPASESVSNGVSRNGDGKAGAADTDDSGVTPVARRLAEENKVDLHQMTGTGPNGRITKDDVAGFIEKRASSPGNPSPPGKDKESAGRDARATSRVETSVSEPPKAAAPVTSGDGRGEERIRMSRRRKTIATRLVETQHTAAMLTTFNEIDMTAVMEVRKRRKDSFKERHGVGLGFMSFFTKATVGALKTFPYLNAEIQGDEIVVKHYYDIGIAVGAEEGLVVPVVRDADRLSFAEIERQIGSLAGRAREGKLTLADLQGGTFTLTNGGIFGSLMSTPILNTPQVGILGMHKIEERAVVVSGEIVIRPMMYVALSYDHRIVDGSEAVRFLVRVKELIEDPESLLLEG